MMALASIGPGLSPAASCEKLGSVEGQSCSRKCVSKYASALCVPRGKHTLGIGLVMLNHAFLPAAGITKVVYLAVK